MKLLSSRADTIAVSPYISRLDCSEAGVAALSFAATSLPRICTDTTSSGCRLNCLMRFSETAFLSTVVVRPMLLAVLSSWCVSGRSARLCAWANANLHVQVFNWCGKGIFQPSGGSPAINDQLVGIRPHLSRLVGPSI